MITSYITIFSFTASPGASLPTKVMSQTSNGTISTSFSPTATAAAYDTCGGTDYEAMACVNGFTCVSPRDLPREKSADLSDARLYLLFSV